MSHLLLLGVLLVAALGLGLAQPHTDATPFLTAAPAAQATPTPRPAPAEDRVGYPNGYQTDYVLMFVYDRPDNRQVRRVYGNAVAAAARPGQPFPYGAILVMETWRARVDDANAPVLDAQGRFIPTELTGVFVQRKEPGFGAAYEAARGGEWEYVAFRPDGSYLTPARNSAPCSACHQDAGAARDFVFRADLYFYNQSGALPTAPPGLAAAGRVVLQSYLFLADTVRVRPGTTVTWVNEDEAVHTVTAQDGSFDSGRLGLGARFSHTFAQPGRYEYICDLHNSMRGTIVVEN